MRVVAIGASDLNSQRNSVPIANKMALAAELSPIRRIWAGLLPPKTARIEQLSTTALDQSIPEYRESQFSKAKWINSQMPASCQSRRRLQQVMPSAAAQLFGQHLPGSATAKNLSLKGRRYTCSLSKRGEGGSRDTFTLAPKDGPLADSLRDTPASTLEGSVCIM
jgi:hypothetical protein